jgi:hypothetical protein
MHKHTEAENAATSGFLESAVSANCRSEENPEVAELHPKRRSTEAMV